MKQRFLNQKLGKRMSRKAELQKAKAASGVALHVGRREKAHPPGRTGAFSSQPAAPGKAG